jgi:hypothetical protein
MSMKGQKTKLKKPYTLICLRRNMPENQAFYFVWPNRLFLYHRARVTANMLTIEVEMERDMKKGEVVSIAMKNLAVSCSVVAQPPVIAEIQAPKTPATSLLEFDGGEQPGVESSGFGSGGEGRRVGHGGGGGDTVDVGGDGGRDGRSNGGGEDNVVEGGGRGVSSGNDDNVVEGGGRQVGRGNGGGDDIVEGVRGISRGNGGGDGILEGGGRGVGRGNGGGDDTVEGGGVGHGHGRGKGGGDGKVGSEGDIMGLPEDESSSDETIMEQLNQKAAEVRRLREEVAAREKKKKELESRERMKRKRILAQLQEEARELTTILADDNEVAKKPSVKDK